MKDIRIILPNPASDTAGSASMLFQLGGLSIIHDAAGSMESYITFDESRELTGKRTVASRLSRLEAITGNDSTLLNKIETECTNNPPPFTAILGSPVPFTIGTDLEGIAAEAEFITGVPSFAVNSGGFAIYDKGAGEALKKVITKTTRPPLGHEGRIINLLGASPMDYSPAEIADMEKYLLNKGFAAVQNLTMTDDAEQIRNAADADYNIVISTSGLPAARYLKQKYNIPYEIGVPFDYHTDWVPSAYKKILLIGESVFTKQLAKILSLLPNVEVVAGIISSDDQEIFPDVTSVPLYTEAAIRTEVRKGYDVILGDPLYKLLLPKDHNCIFLNRPHRALSGRLYPFSEYKLNHYLNELKGCLT
jgi:nitrogenase molybdenum-iron protein alpha/beta subunit